MIWKKILVAVIVIVIIAIVGYGLFTAQSYSGGGGDNGDNGGTFASLGARNLVVLTVLGASAFITGFGARDVIGRAVASRQRSKLKLAQQQQVRH